ncbi:hypothetical protein BH23CHL5_BH23CHL5_16800 [soil metagenome]
MSDDSPESTLASIPKQRSRAPSQLGQWIRSTRQAIRLNQRELAQRAGVSRSYLCNIERGYGVQPSIQVLDRLAVALEVSRNDLLAAAGVLETASPNRPLEAERRFMVVYRSLEVEDRASVERYARFLQSEERRWNQPALIDDSDADQQSDFRTSGRTLFDLETLEPNQGAT